MSTIYLFYTDPSKEEGHEGLVWDRKTKRIYPYSTFLDMDFIYDTQKHSCEEDAIMDAEQNMSPQAKKALQGLRICMRTKEYLVLIGPTGRIPSKLYDKFQTLEEQEQRYLLQALDTHTLSKDKPYYAKADAILDTVQNPPKPLVMRRPLPGHFRGHEYNQG